jgi:pilus assembly protein CpaC
MKANRHSVGASLRAMLLAAGLACGVAVGSAAAQPAASSAVASSELVISVGKSQVLEVPTAYTDLMIADPKIADVLPLSDRSVYVVGKAPGSTVLTIYGPGKRLIAATGVVVSADIDSLKSRLNQLLPNERDIAIQPANQSLVLSGSVSSAPVLQRVLALAETYAPGKVVNMLGVEGTQQVMLSVRIVEMERNTAKALRLNVESQDPTADIFFNTGETILTGALVDTFGSISAFLGGGSSQVDLLFDALETKGLIKTLAEPNLVAMSGDTANFLAGGEFPIPVAQSSAAAGGEATITIAFKQFGIALAFTPTVLSDGLINIVVNPEVSSIDPSTTINTGSVRIPGIKVRRASTTVELRDGESFTIAGLLKDNYENSVRQFPFLGEIPIIGAFFRSTGYQHSESELVIVVTPHLVVPRRGSVATPADRFIPPSDFELFVAGDQIGNPGNLRPEDRVLLRGDPAKGGVEGPFGHVLH